MSCKPHPLPSQENLRELLDYCPETGIFKWRPRGVETFNSQRYCNSWNTKYAGKVAGSVDINGYIIISIAPNNYLAHRIAWKYMYGTEPSDLLDHEDNTRDNNRLSNLREASYVTNRINCQKYKNNTTGVKGVTLRKSTGKYSATVQKAKKRIYLGDYDTLAEAQQVRKQAAEKIHGTFHNHG